MSIRDHIQRRWRRSEAIAVAAYPLRRYLPTARIRDAVMTRRGLKWGVPAMLLAIPYLAAIALISDVITQSGPEWGWLHLVNLLCAWNALKMLWLGPISLIQLVRARRNEQRQQRMARQAQGHEPEPHLGRAPVLTGGAARRER